MDAISISAASGMRARMESLELLANNLANVETGGFKADREFYSLYSSIDATPDPVTGQVATLPVIESHWTDLAQGDLKVTGNPLDFAVDGEGLFAIQTPQGIRYTRNGNFRISQTGQLTNGEGYPVLSRAGTPVVLRQELPVEAQPNGVLQQPGQAPVQLNLVAFDPRAISKEGHNYFAAVAGATPRTAGGTVHQGSLEASNVAAPESAVRLVAIMRQFEMLQRAASIGNELNKRAMEEIARVTT
jgi:flagellar basal-body rod protein FlgF